MKPQPLDARRCRGVILPLYCALFMLVAFAAEGASLVSAARKGRVDQVRTLIEEGADLEKRDFGGNTAIYHAARKGHADVVRLLAEAGADIDVDNRFGSTPLHVASRAGHVEVIRVLAEFGADLDARNLSGGHSSALRGGADAALNRRSLASSTPLEKAARAGQLAAVQALIELGAALPARGAVEAARLHEHDEIAAYITRAAGERRRAARREIASSSPLTSEPVPNTKPFEIGSDYRRKVAAVVGISRYSKMSSLEGAARDARETAELLRTLGFDEVFELYDEDATRSRILELLGNTLRAKTGPEDLAFVFFAGHGATETLPNGAKRGFLVPTEGTSEDAYVSGISMETVADLSNRLAARHVYYAVDACYSGGLVATPREGVRGLGERANRSVQVLTAGLEGQQAAEEDGRGVFTTFLLQGLRGDANLNGDGVVTATEIGWFVSNQVDQKTRGAQTPAFGRLGGTGEVAFRLPPSKGED